MSERIVYEIWYFGPSCSKPMSEFLTVFPYYRDEVVSVDVNKLKNTLQKLNAAYADDVTSFEIREKHD